MAGGWSPARTPRSSPVLAPRLAHLAYTSVAYRARTGGRRVADWGRRGCHLAGEELFVDLRRGQNRCATSLAWPCLTIPASSWGLPSLAFPCAGLWGRSPGEAEGRQEVTDALQCPRAQSWPERGLRQNPAPPSSLLLRIPALLDRNTASKLGIKISS